METSHLQPRRCVRSQTFEDQPWTAASKISWFHSLHRHLRHASRKAGARQLRTRIPLRWCQPRGAPPLPPPQNAWPGHRSPGTTPETRPSALQKPMALHHRWAICSLPSSLEARGQDWTPDGSF